MCLCKGYSPKLKTTQVNKKAISRKAAKSQRKAGSVVVLPLDSKASDVLRDFATLRENVFTFCEFVREQL
jgi:hypothetical protein